MMYKKLLLSAIGIIGAVVLSFAEMKRPYFGYAPGHSQYKTLLTGDGCMLRGGTLKGIGKELDHEQYEYIFDHDWASIYVNKKLNMAVCKVLFKYDRFDDLYPTMQDLADDLDQVVQMAKEEGLYLMINYNSVYNDGWDIDKYMEYWKFFAGRYADEKHVFYELVNEPNCSYLQTDYHSVDTVAARWQRMYDVVRDRAPNTPILLFSWVHCFDEMHYNVLQEMDIDKSLTGVSFHLYCSNPLDHETMKNFKESGLGFLMTEQDGNDDVMDMENNGISWISWDGMRPGNWDWTDDHNHNWEIPCVEVNSPPEVSIINPHSDTVIKAGNDIDLTADASDQDGNILKVAFYKGNEKLGEDESEPFTFSWTDITKGTYEVVAKATDDSNQTTVSKKIVIEALNNLRPAISITKPLDNSFFIEGQDINISADASDSDGSISKVEFYNNGSKLGEDDSIPYDYTISGLSAGNYSFEAKAIDNEGASATSKPVSVTIGTPHDLPGTINAEDFYDMEGIKVSDSDDGGQHLGYIDKGDWFEYNVNVTESGEYKMTYTVASKESGVLELLVDGSSIQQLNVPNTGGWEQWTTVSGNIQLSKGLHTFRYQAPEVHWNLDLIKAELVSEVTGIVKSPVGKKVNIYPDPSTGKVHIKGLKGKNGTISVHSSLGEIILDQSFNGDQTIDLTDKPNGLYFITIRSETFKISEKLILK